MDYSYSLEASLQFKAFLQLVPFGAKTCKDAGRGLLTFADMRAQHLKLFYQDCS